ncbi:helix-turn-helix transcriptional regulator [Herbaspirillum robiniae]|uniref:AraC family transcriptional regulator n=1 Tax=Herbaspirillum robiniae TaxID=2014887 RepID=A0A246WL55_9BURK|nr:helix-turn-helix transcriptional regulator [Herbaspirillum robiniae]OWY27039.1 AraC family transcriptional regulator [Herbaspirillum robiniae]
MTTSFQDCATASHPPSGAGDRAPAALRFGERQQHGGASVYRKSYDGTARLQIPGPSSGAGFLLGVSMTPEHRRRITRGELAGLHLFSQGDIYLRDLEDPYAAEVDAPFDFTLLEFSRDFFEAMADERIEPATVALSPVAARRDPVLPHLACALQPSLARPAETCALFVEQILVAMGAYLVHAYGGFVPAQTQPGLLSKVHEERAKAMLLSKVRGECSIPDIARECNMSASYFMKAFKKTTGQTPHQWMLSQRLARAQDYLRNSTLSLAEVATTCDFYDQSHFNRVFIQGTGMSPGVWRRQAA